MGWIDLLALAPVHALGLDFGHPSRLVPLVFDLLRDLYSRDVHAYIPRLRMSWNVVR